jgi:hypothetical protein
MIKHVVRSMRSAERMEAEGFDGDFCRRNNLPLKRALE